MDSKRVLFVDDEPGIRQTLPRVLQMFGYEAVTVGSVAEALTAITSQHFDVLIADLNIGQPGDGFTVVSAMRRTQPHCITLILTGYPALDTALQAIRSQVDDYIIKPASIPSLLGVIERKLQHQGQRHPVEAKRVAVLLREREGEIIERTLQAMKAEPELCSLPLTDGQRIEHLPQTIAQLCQVLDSGCFEAGSPASAAVTRAGVECGPLGERGSWEGYSIPLLAVNLRVLQATVYEIIHENLLSLNLSHLMPDLILLNGSLARQLQQALREFLDAEHRAA
jgi:ActR/RegA family two-component response regulator